MANNSSGKQAFPAFQLRPNKFVDRMLFLDLMSRNIGNRGAQNYVYVSMGAKFLHDHHAVYRRTGIEALVSFDRLASETSRQRFNRPTSGMDCITLDSAELPGKLEEIRGRKSAIIWLDFMVPGERRSQFQQAVEVLRCLQPGDLLRVTINAHYPTLGTYDRTEKKRYCSESKWAAAQLLSQIQEYLPGGLETLQAVEFSTVLARSVGIAADQAKIFRPDIKIIPILSTSYADGHRMITVACAVRDSAEKKLPASLDTWKFRSRTWDKLLDIHVPELSAREKQFIDRRLSNSPSKIFRSLPFKPGTDKETIELKRAIKSYKALHRYYPEFHHIEF